MNCDCTDYTQAASRRSALRAALGLTGLAAVATFGATTMETAYAASGVADRMVVVLSLRGAADGLSLVVPHADPVYYAARPSIAVPKDSLLAPDAFFGLNPALAPLLPLWQAGKMAAIHAAGQEVTTRSHFAAMEEVEDADPGSSKRVGWLNRLMDLRPGTPDPLSAVQLGSVVQATQIAGPAPTMAAQELDQLRVSGPGGDYDGVYRQGLASLWPSAATDRVGQAGNRAIGIARTLNSTLAPGSDLYPDGDLGAALRDAARLLKANVGAEVITVDQGSWDHHQWLGTINDGSLKRMATPLAQGLAAFFEDLGDLAERVTVVTVTEFGRRVKENGNQGLDHGHGSVMFALGAGVRGGYYASWPGLENTQDADLAVTTDYRNVLGEVVNHAFPDRSLSLVFPSLSYRPVGFMESVVVDGEKPLLPISFYADEGAKTGIALAGRRVRAPEPVLSPAGEEAQTIVAHRWDVRWPDGTKQVVGRRPLLRVSPDWRGATLRVRVSGSAQDYRTRHRVYSYGVVR